MWQGVAWCLVIAAVYVSCLYLKRTPASRQHPATVKWRITSVLMASSVAWVPVWIRLKQVQQQHNIVSSDLLSMLQLLSIRPPHNLLAATLLSLAQTAALFSGPLLFKAVVASEQRQQRKQTMYRSSWAPSIYTLRDIVIAPLTEEWCFRACMVPLLWLEGAKLNTIIFVVPLFFGLCHLHHARELVHAQGWPLGNVLPVVCFQMLYTTVFGWYAAWLMVSQGHLAPAVTAHAFCNYMGLPPFAAMMSHKRRKILLFATVVGMVVFAIALRQNGQRRPGPVWYPFTRHLGSKIH